MHLLDVSLDFVMVAVVLDEMVLVFVVLLDEHFDLVGMDDHDLDTDKSERDVLVLHFRI